MSSRKRKTPTKVTKKKQEKQAPPVEQKEMRLARPVGVAPRPMVLARHARGSIEREGRGFSNVELRSAAFPIVYARRWRLPIDLRRRSAIETNVQALKKWFVPPRPEPPATKPAPRTKKVPKPAKPKKRARRKRKAKR